MGQLMNPNISKKMQQYASANSGLTWVTFHGAHDYGFLLKTLLGCERALPAQETGFWRMMEQLFADSYDLKHVAQGAADALPEKKGLGLASLAAALGVPRDGGAAHMAGSDALLTARTFMRLRAQLFQPSSFGTPPPLGYPLQAHRGVLFGLGESAMDFVPLDLAVPGVTYRTKRSSSRHRAMLMTRRHRQREESSKAQKSGKRGRGKKWKKKRAS